MFDPRENTPFEPRAELKTKLDQLGYTYEFGEYNGLKLVKFNLPVGQCSLSIKQAEKKTIDQIRSLIADAMNQDEIKAGLPQNPIAPDDEITI